MLDGGAGADLLDGGAGIDRVDYGSSGAGVVIDLADGAASGGEAAGDRLVGIEAVDGSAFADTLSGTERADWFGGGAGDDRIDGRSEERTSELQSLMRNSYAVFCLKKKK